MNPTHGERRKMWWWFIASPLLCCTAGNRADAGFQPLDISERPEVNAPEVLVRAEQRCTPGTVLCARDGRSLVRCSSDGTEGMAVRMCASTERCLRGQCVDPCNGEGSENDYQGCEFLAVQTLNSTLGSMVQRAQRSDFPFAIAVTNPWSESVRVTFEGGALTTRLERTINAGELTVIEVPWMLALAEGGARSDPGGTLVRGGAIHIRASLPVAAYQFNPLPYTSDPECVEPRCYSYTNDASLLLPVRSLRNRYVVPSWPTVRFRVSGDTQWQAFGGFVTVAAATAATVTLRTQANTTATDAALRGSAGSTMTVQLQAGDVVQWVSSHNPTCERMQPDTARGDVFCAPVREEDFTGSVVESDVPVAVFAGHDCALVPHDRYACDHLEEQLFPTTALGRRYLVGRTQPSRNEPNVLRVVAVRARTTVNFMPSSVHASVELARAGDFVETQVNEAVEVSSSEPVVAAQYLVGMQFDQNQRALNGDPDMALVVPEEQARDRYFFIAAPDYEHTVAVVLVPRGESLLLNGYRVDAPTRATLGTFDLRYVPIAAGPARLEAERVGVRFSAMVSGLSNFTSYSYPAGLDLAAIAPPQ